MCRGGTVSYTDQFNRGESEGKCAVEACNGEFRVEIASLSLDFAQFCIDLVGNVATESASGTSGGELPFILLLMDERGTGLIDQ